MAKETDSRRELLEIFKFFPGIGAESAVRPAQDGGVELAMAFDDSAHGKTARMAVEFIVERVGAKQKGERNWHCDPKQTLAFKRYLNYASLRPMGKARPPAKLGVTPLPTLLSRALHAFERDYDALAATDPSTPHLGVWANVLRVIPNDGLDLRELGPQAILASRAVRVVVRDLQAQGWLDLQKEANVRARRRCA